MNPASITVLVLGILAANETEPFPSRETFLEDAAPALSPFDWKPHVISRDEREGTLVVAGHVASQTLACQATRQAVLVKLALDGRHLWSRRASPALLAGSAQKGASRLVSSRIHGIAVDPATSQIFAAGDMLFAEPAGDCKSARANALRAFVASWTPDGTPASVVEISSISSLLQQSCEGACESTSPPRISARAVAVDRQGTIIVTGIVKNAKDTFMNTTAMNTTAGGLFVSRFSYDLSPESRSDVIFPHSSFDGSPLMGAEMSEDAFCNRGDRSPYSLVDIKAFNADISGGTEELAEADNQNIHITSRDEDSEFGMELTFRSTTHTSEAYLTTPFYLRVITGINPQLSTTVMLRNQSTKQHDIIQETNMYLAKNEHIIRIGDPHPYIAVEDGTVQLRLGYRALSTDSTGVLETRGADRFAVDIDKVELVE